jgi:SHS2 domain-containing protein
MPFHYLEDVAIADVAFEARGTTLEELFLAAAQATLGVMVQQPETLMGTEQISIHLENNELDLLLFDFLQEIIFYKDAQRLLLRITQLQVNHESVPVTVNVSAVGAAIGQGSQQLLIDVKAVTLYRFAVNRDHSGWRATVVLDV